jgi:hypothetical protein
MNVALKNKITQLMAKEKLHQLCIDVFLSQYKKMASGEQSVIRENSI